MIWSECLIISAFLWHVSERPRIDKPLRFCWNCQQDLVVQFATVIEGSHGFSHTTHHALPYTAHVRTGGWIERPLGLSIGERVCAMIVDFSNLLHQITIGSDEVRAIIGKDFYWRSSPADETTDRHNTRISGQIVCYFQMDGSHHQAGENNAFLYAVQL